MFRRRFSSAIDRDEQRDTRWLKRRGSVVGGRGAGEFHICVAAAPIFRRPIPLRLGKVVEQDGFLRADPLCGSSEH